MKEIYFAGGCFWGTEHYFKQVRGVVSTEVGYANGNTPMPTYEQVYSDKTGYVETVHVVYDPNIVDLALLVRLFFDVIDPLSYNQQGEDVGTRYRTGIYYTSDDDISVISDVYSSISELLGEKLAVELLPLKNYYSAEEYHQDYLEKNPMGYCHIPRLKMVSAYNANRKED